MCITEPSIDGNLTGSKENKEDPERIQKWAPRHSKSKQPRLKRAEEVKVRVENKEVVSEFASISGWVAI